MEHITIRAFRAVDDRETCVRYVMEHARVLEDVGVASAFPAMDTWVLDPSVIVIVAEHEDLGLVAGVRFQMARPGSQLPMDKYLSKADPVIHGYLNSLQQGGSGELCGLWNAKRFAGRGVPFLLISCGVALANQLGITTMVTFSAEYMVPNTKRVGFITLDGLGMNGEFQFPVPRIRSYAMVIPDVATLAHASDGDRQRIFSIRLNPLQTRIERPKETQLVVDYMLLLSEQQHYGAYREVQQQRIRSAA